MQPPRHASLESGHSAPQRCQPHPWAPLGAQGAAIMALGEAAVRSWGCRCLCLGDGTSRGFRVAKGWLHMCTRQALGQRLQPVPVVRL